MIRCDPFPDCTIPSDTKITIIRQIGGEALLSSIVATGKAGEQPLLGLHSTLFLVLAYDVLDDLKKAKPKLSLNASFTRLNSKEKREAICDTSQYIDDREYVFTGTSNDLPGLRQPISSGCYFFLWLSKIASKAAIRIPIPQTILLGFGLTPGLVLNFTDKIQVKPITEIQESVWKLLEDDSDFAYVREEIVTELRPGTFAVTEKAEVLTMHEERVLQKVLNPTRVNSICIQKVIQPNKGQFRRLRVCLLPNKETAFMITPRNASNLQGNFNPQRSLMNFLPDSIFTQTASTSGIRDFMGLPTHHPVVNFPANEHRNVLETMKVKVQVMEFILQILNYAKDAGLTQLNKGTTITMIRYLRRKLVGLKEWVESVGEIKGKSETQVGVITKKMAEDALETQKCTVYQVANLTMYEEPFALLRQLKSLIDTELGERKVTSIVADFTQEVTGKWYLLDVQKLDTAVSHRPKDIPRSKVIYNKCAGDFCRLVGTFSPEQMSQFAQMLLRKGFTNASIYLSDRDPAHSMLWEHHFYKILRKVILDERADPASLSRAAKLLKGENPGDRPRASWGIDTVQVCYLCYLLYTRFENILPKLHQR